MAKIKKYRVTSYIHGKRCVKELPSAEVLKYINGLLLLCATVGVEPLE